MIRALEYGFWTVKRRITVTSLVVIVIVAVVNVAAALVVVVVVVVVVIHPTLLLRPRCILEKVGVNEKYFHRNNRIDRGVRAIKPMTACPYVIYVALHYIIILLLIILR
jgi:hypothetical protein